MAQPRDPNLMTVGDAFCRLQEAKLHFRVAERIRAKAKAAGARAATHGEPEVRGVQYARAYAETIDAAIAPRAA